MVHKRLLLLSMEDEISSRNIETKYISLNNMMVLLTQVPTSGGPPIKRHLAEHSKSAHKLYTNPAEPHIIISAGEDGNVILSDVRQDKPEHLFTVRTSKSKIALYSVAGHPLDINEMCVAGKNRHVMVYDRRNANQEVKKFCPEFFRNISTSNKDEKKIKKRMSAYITCAIYNHNGSEILASYNDDDIYLFDTMVDWDLSVNSHGYSHIYCGHRNNATFKGVSFFGPQSEFIVSGSDCANIYIWDKKTQAIVQWMMADETGVVNCIEYHPRFPVLASSGLDKDIKIWVPSNEDDPKLTGLRETVIRNAHNRIRRPLFQFYPAYYNVFERAGIIPNSDENPDSDSTPENLDVNACRPF